MTDQQNHYQQLNSLNQKFVLNENAQIEVLTVGDEQTPVIIIEQLSASVSQLIDFAEDGSTFGDAGGFYPGIRKPLPKEYAINICKKYLPLIKKVYQLEATAKANIVLSALSLAVTPQNKLRPIQTLPHFDTTAHNQFAVVHYLCDQQHGGTSFYRHKSTGFERISDNRLTRYGSLLKQQAIACQLHKHLAYMQGDNELFSLIHSVKASMNRAIIYPSNLLHSGNINIDTGLLADPRKGRLTTSSFILVQ